MKTPHILILGGTGEARKLSTMLSGEACRVTLSLAGRTADPIPHAGAMRRGGFGGAEGLARYLEEHAVDLLVDATHPFAARISENAEIAAQAARVPLVALERPAWTPLPGDCWHDATNIAEAAALLGTQPRSVFLAIGRQELAPFKAHPQHAYVVRSVDAVAPTEAPERAHFILDRGPFPEADERALFHKHVIDIVVAKNSGGSATYGKIVAARDLGLPVIMVHRPRPPTPGAVESTDAAFEQIRHILSSRYARGE